MTITAPEKLITNLASTSIFLAGSIEQNKASQWQQYVIEKLKSKYHLFNPRRKTWDSGWKQSIDNPQFCEQVNWELNALELCDVIFMYFEPETLSPITLLELGLFANSSKLHVICPEGFWRKGNVDIVCQRNLIPMYDSIDDLVNYLLQIK